MRKRSPGKDAVLPRGRKRQQKTEKQDEKRKQKKGHDRMFRGGFDRALLVCVLLPFVAQAQVNINDARVILNSGKSLEQAIADGDLSGSGTPLCTAAQLAADSCGGTTTNALAIVTDAGRDAFTANTCETSTPTPTRSYVCQRDSGGTWRPMRSGPGALTIAASNAPAYASRGADIRCAAQRCDQEIQAAINTLQGYTGTGILGGAALHFTAGVFGIEATVVLGGDAVGSFRRVNLIGEGPEVTVLDAPTGVDIGDVIKYEGNATSPDVLFYTFRDLSVNGAGIWKTAATVADDCIDMLGTDDAEDAWDVHVQNVMVADCGGACYRGYSWGLSIIDSVLERCGFGVLLSHGSDAKVSGNKITHNGINVYLQTDAENGGRSGNPTGARLVNNLFQQIDPGSYLPNGYTADNVRITGYNHHIVGNYLGQLQYANARNVLRLDNAYRNIISNNVFDATIATSGAMIEFADATSAYNLFTDNLIANGSGQASVNSAATQNVIQWKNTNDGFLNLHTDSISGMRLYNNDGDTASVFGTVLKSPPTTLMSADVTLPLPISSPAEGQEMVYDASLGRLRQYSEVRRAVNWVRDPRCAGLWLRTASDGSNECEATPDGTVVGAGVAIAQFGAESVPTGTPSTHYRLDNPATAGPSGLQITDAASIETQPATVGCWIYSDDDTPAFHYWLQHGNSAAAGYRSYIDAAANRLYTEWGVTTAVESSTAVATDGAWHHLVMAYDTTDSTAKIYVDGALACNGACGTGASANLNSTAALYVGGMASGSFALDGRAYECFYANRALTQHEVCSIARCGFSDDIADRLLSCDMGGIVCSN